MAFAAKAHAYQKRDDMRDAYVNHLIEVAAACARHEPFDPVLVAAALLHDTIEDTDTTEPELRELFGDEVTGVVLEVTDPLGLKGKARRQRQVTHSATASDRAKLIKIADKTSNVAELIDAPGGIGRIRKAKRYLGWAERVVAVCRGLDAEMEATFDATLLRARAGLEEGTKSAGKRS